MSRIQIRLVGGLGNQMFQYAAARSLALRTGGEVGLDLSWFGTDPERQYALEPFAIKAEIIGRPTKKNKVNYVLDKAIRSLGLTYAAKSVPSFAEASFRYDARIAEVKPPVILDGYFQSEKYFEMYRAQISSEFTVRSKPSFAANRLLDKISNTNSICLHIRRGDYISNPNANSYHGTCSLDYYREGLDFVSKDLESPHGFVFSDDPDWVRENFRSDLPATLVDIHRPEQAHEDLRLMAACQRFVIANSSLSWWGAWLGGRSGKKVVAPQNWFRNDAIDSRDLLPVDWEKL